MTVAILLLACLVLAAAVGVLAVALRELRDRVRVLEVARVPDVGHVAFTFIWVTETVSGTPVGTQVAEPSAMTSGWPPDFTRTVPTDQVAVVHGPVPAFGGGFAQPEIVQGGDRATVALPPTFTRGLGVVGEACPPCAHITVAPCSTR